MQSALGVADVKIVLLTPTAVQTWGASSDTFRVSFEAPASEQARRVQGVSVC